MLFIQGEHLHLGLQPSDYRVIIGKTECNVTDLGDSELQCRPVKPSSVGDNEPRQSVEVISIISLQDYALNLWYFIYNRKNLFMFLRKIHQYILREGR